jgi:UDP-glucose 4-epimerase
MKILVTGGAGFIGSHVADAFIEAGHDVAIVDDLSSGVNANLNPKATFHQIDIRSPKIAEIFAKEQPEVLCHHAAQINVRRSVAEPVFDADVNLGGLLNLLEHGRRNGLRKVLLASTGGAIYGEQTAFPAPETHPTAPLSPYGIAKLASEHYLFFYSQTYGLDYTALRYANVYGPRQNPHGEAGVIAIFAKKLLRGEQPVINGDGKQTRDYVFIRDIARGNVAALTADYRGAINLGTGIETCVNELFTTLVRLGRFAAPEKHGPAMPGEQRRSVIDNTLAQKILGWRPTVTLEEGLNETLAFFRAEAAN